MNGLIDLHTHSTISDGSMTPSELVRHAKSAGLVALALTDHDSVDGVEEALAEGKRIGIEVIPGLEISVDFKPEMHILGYFPEQAYKRIETVLDLLRESRQLRNPRIIDKLNEMGFDITMKEVEAEAGKGIVGRPHIAKVLLAKGYVSSVEDAFDRLLGCGKPAYFKKERLTPEEGIKEILKAGGVPVLAHPIYLGHSLEALDKLLGELAQVGLKGIEAIYVDNTKEETGNLLRLAIKHKLLVTGGSDFHGSYKPDIEIGKGRGNLEVTYDLLKKIKDYM
ncbi:MAG: PHP domain-containing protein [Clostridia bacterium]|nr:PHP domain-containing protein [Clostridia bacterium]